MATVNSSWMRLLDEPQKHAGVHSIRSGRAPPLEVNEVQQVPAWENEGGQSGLGAEPARILIIDEDIQSSSSLELMLHSSGYSQTRVAYSGHAALAIAADFHPSIVLLELALLDMSGHEVARMLRERAHSRDLRLVALTSSREHDGRELARVAGFERYLLKPVAAPDLAGLIADAWR